MQGAPSKIILGLTILAALAPAMLAEPDPGRQPLARIGEQFLYEEDLLPSIGPKLFQLRNHEFEIRMTALQNLINHRLLEEEAKTAELSIQQLAESVDRKVAQPDAAEIEAYYFMHPDPLGRGLDEIRSQLEMTVAQIKLQQARHDFLDQLQRKAGVSILYSRPKVEVSSDASRIRGALDAPVMIVEFADFECSYCQAAEEPLRQIVEKYKGKVSLAFHDFPLKEIHPQAQQAAEASRCAGEQGKFWEYHDLLLVNGARLDPEGLREQAQNLGADAELFGACMKSRRFAAAVVNDRLTGYKSGVASTPTFYINGMPLVGIQPASAFEKLIDSELQLAGSEKSVQ